MSQRSPAELQADRDSCRYLQAHDEGYRTGTEHGRLMQRHEDSYRLPMGIAIGIAIGAIIQPIVRWLAT